MVIDKITAEQGITAALLAQLIDKHSENTERFNELEKYYKGEHEILNRTRISKGIANNKVVCNHAKYITDITTSYLAGNPVTYAAAEEFDISALNNEYLEQDIASLDSELVKNSSVYGRAYELIYADEEGRAKSVSLNPKTAFVVYDGTAAKKPLFGVYYYKRYDISGNCIGVSCSVYDAETVRDFASDREDWRSMTLEGEAPHYFGGVPLIEYKNNAERQGDFEQLIPLIDAYNLLCSDRVNDKEQFVDAFLFLKGIEIDSDQAKKLREERILMGDDLSDAKYLSKSMTESDINILRNDLKQDIHRFSMVPDLSDESFGSNLSGVAIKYKLMGFEQHVRNKERYIAKGLKKRFKLYNAFLAKKNSMAEVPVSQVDVIFTRNLPANNLETAEMINQLKDIVSDETLLGQLDFVTDAKEEANAAAREREQTYRNKITAVEDLAEGGGY